ncbi:MAG: GntR family transcriptional regulator [Sphaerobacter sp.]|nr:GntR family transcriptional regulator [Sphaerobacter sp.]
MVLTIDLSSEVPIYQQLRDRIVEGIAAGHYRVGSALPSTRQLAADFGINFHTVSKAYELLRQEGLVRITRRQGAVIHRDPTTGPPEPIFADAWEARARTVLAEAYAHGMRAEDILARCERILAGFAAAESRSEGR